jgi:hypothetical protein
LPAFSPSVSLGLSSPSQHQAGALPPQQLTAIGASHLLAVDVDAQADLADLLGVVALDRSLLLVLPAELSGVLLLRRAWVLRVAVTRR